MSLDTRTLQLLAGLWRRKITTVVAEDDRGAVNTSEVCRRRAAGRSRRSTMFMAQEKWMLQLRVLPRRPKPLAHTSRRHARASLGKPDDRLVFESNALAVVAQVVPVWLKCSHCPASRMANLLALTV